MLLIEHGSAPTRRRSHLPSRCYCVPAATVTAPIARRSSALVSAAVAATALAHRWLSSDRRAREHSRGTAGGPALLLDRRALASRDGDRDLHDAVAQVP